MEQNKMTSFERMKKAVYEMVKEELEVNVTSCKSHTSCTLKIVALPDEVDTVEVYVPYQIFVGAKTSEACMDWDVNVWKIALMQLCFEFGVKDCPITRLMTKRPVGVSARMYANHFWKKFETMNRWNIVVSEISSIKSAELRNDKNNKPTEKKIENVEIYKKSEIVNAFELMGLKFCCN